MPAQQAVLDESIDKTNGREGFSSPRCHLDQGPRAVFDKGFFQFLDGLKLTLPQSAPLKCREVLIFLRCS